MKISWGRFLDVLFIQDVKRVQWHITVRIFKLTLGIGDWFGNTFWPAFLLTIFPKYPDKRSARFLITVRISHVNETKIYGNIRGLWWNSTFIARKFGKELCDDMHGIYGYHYDGWLGTHYDV